jgi:hypothetical protein
LSEARAKAICLLLVCVAFLTNQRLTSHILTFSHRVSHFEQNREYKERIGEYLINQPAMRFWLIVCMVEQLS